MASWLRDDEEDYMSEKVLAKCQDRRPGLVPTRVAREYQKEKRTRTLNQMNRTKPRTVLEAEKRAEGMSNALDSSNKGFAMLQKMGYKPGMGVGKTASGVSEPISINLRVGRTGLGHETEVSRKREATIAHQKAQAAKRQKMTEQNQKKFQTQQSEKFFEKLSTKDLYKSQRVCEQLDSQKGITEPSEPFFWPPNLLPIKDEEDAKKRSDYYGEDGDNEDKESDDKDSEEEDLLTPSEKLQILTLYLRNRHLYCIWCGTTFSDKKDMADNCPGDNAEAHDD